MPFDANGNHALPPGYEAKTGQKVLPSNHNPPLEDLSASLSATFLRNGNSPMTGNIPMGGNKIVDLGKGTSANDAVTFGQLTSTSPIGIVSDFAGTTAPSGWLLCYGQAVSRTEYADLFAVIGTAFGTGNGSSTFNVPDMRGRVSVGKDDMGGTDAERMTFFAALAKTLGAVFGAASHTLTIEQTPEHDHGGKVKPAGKHTPKITLDNRRGADGNAGTSSGWDAGDTRVSQNVDKWLAEVPDHEHEIIKQGGSKAHTNTQPSIVFNKIIRAVAA